MFEKEKEIEKEKEKETRNQSAQPKPQVAQPFPPPSLSRTRPTFSTAAQLAPPRRSAPPEARARVALAVDREVPQVSAALRHARPTPQAATPSPTLADKAGP